MILTGVAILFSSFSSPALSALLAFLVFIIGHFSQSLNDFAQNLGSNAAKVFFEILYWILPNLSNFSFITNAAHGDVPPLNFFGASIGYAIFYSAVLIAAAVLIFKRRNFK